MNRHEILKRMQTGAEYLERTDLTPEKRLKGEMRYAELEAELKRIDQEEAEARSKLDPAVMEQMNKIREILGMPKRW